MKHTIRCTILSAMLALCLALAAPAGAQTVSGGSPRSVISFGNPQTQVPTNATTFLCSSGGGITNEANCVTTVPFNAIIRNLYVVAGLPQGAGQTAIITLRTAPNAGGVFADSALSCTMSNVQSCSDTTHSVLITPGQVYSLRVVMSATAATASYGLAAELDAN